MADGGWRRIARKDVMRKVEDIERQILELSREEFAELRNWLAERDWQTWDVQIESDGRAGKLDRLVSEALDDYQAGRAQPK
jgi:hypothetical protein